MVLLLICGILFLCYGALVIYFWGAWSSIPEFVPSAGPGPTFSVIIPARNEEKTIGDLLTALQHQSYPASLFEVLVIDDHSTDRTAEIVRGFAHVQLIALEADPGNSYKKKALETGISRASHEWIVTTDADCIPEKDWLLTMASFANSTKARFIAAPVFMRHNASLLQLFQTLDFMILQAITGAAVQRKLLSMCNGANLAYPVSVFRDVKGFEGIDKIASGDDMLLMHKIRMRYPRDIYYLKTQQAIVTTEPQKTWRSFLNQRIRWASKAGHYDDKRFFPVLLLVYLFNCSFLSLVIAGFICTCFWKWLFLFWAAKTLVELPLFLAAARFFHRQKLAGWFFLFQPLHIFYTICSGLLGQFGRYEWKGRRVH